MLLIIMAVAAANVVELQDEVERILRRLSLEETREVAGHLQIGDIPDEEGKRDVLRRIQDTFDEAADDQARNLLLRGLPIPEAYRENYERVFAPQNVDNDGDPNGEQQVNVPAQAPDQVVPRGPVQEGDNGVPVQENIQQNAMFAGGLLQAQMNPGFLQLQQEQNVYGGPLQPNGGALNAGGAIMGGLNAAGGANLPLPNAGPGRVGNAVGANAANHNLGVVAQNRLLHAQAGGLLANPMNVGVRNVFNVGAAQNGIGDAAANIVGAQNVVNAGPVRPRGIPQNVGLRAPAPNIFGAARNNFNGGQAQNMQNLGGWPQAGPNVQGLAQFPQYPPHRFVQMFPREFRMTGSISDDISKSMTYLDICRQVSDGRRKGYSDDEILSGMRRVMTTGAVKTYVDSQADQPLEEILLFLRSFLKTETPSELNNRLSQLAQQGDQTAIKFFMDALEIRQLIIVGSQVEGNVVHDPKLVHSTFLHTIRTGLRDESVRSHMLPFLSETNLVNDNSLIRELHKAVSEAEERRKKTEQAAKKPSVKVNVVESSPELAALMKLVQDNQTQMKAMQEQMGELLRSNPAVKRFNKPGCEACAAANKAQSCKHCWKCGGDGHKANEADKCPKSK